MQRLGASPHCKSSAHGSPRVHSFDSFVRHTLNTYCMPGIEQGARWHHPTLQRPLFISQFSCSVVFDSVTPWTAACKASLSITNSWSLLKLMSIASVMPSNHLILCHPLLLPSIFPNIRVFSSKSALHIRWPKYWSFSFNISPSNEHPGLISFRMDWLGLLAV